MGFETRKQSMAWLNTGYKYRSKDTHFRWKIKWRLELLGSLRIMGETARIQGVEVGGRGVGRGRGSVGLNEAPFSCSLTLKKAK